MRRLSRAGAVDPVPERFRKFLGALERGNSIPTAAEYAGIDVATVYRWLKDPRPQYRAMRDQVEQAKATAVVYVVSNLMALSKRSYRAALAWLKVHGGPEWRSRCQNCGAEQGHREGHDGLRRVAREAIDRQASMDSKGQAPEQRPILLSTDDPAKQVYIGFFDPANAVPEYPELTKEWRWPIGQMLSAAGSGTTPAAFFKQKWGVGPGLREDAEPRPEWWELPIEEARSQ